MKLAKIDFVSTALWRFDIDKNEYSTKDFLNRLHCDDFILCFENKLKSKYVKVLSKFGIGYVHYETLRFIENV